MNISTNTISVLKNFSSINNSIFVNPGNQIKTISPQKTVLATADVDEDFKKPFGIYDLNQFLSVVGIFDNPDFKFEDTAVTISDKNSSVTYVYADQNMIMQPPSKELNLPDTVVDFELKSEVYKKTLQAAGVLQVPNWSVIGENGKVSIIVKDAKSESSNAFRYEVGDTNSEFNLVFKVENLKFMPNDYNVKISSKGISHFSADNGKLSYWIATESR